MRMLSEPFIADLKGEKGILHPLLKRVWEDDTLMLAIRRDYINIYYRGGNIIRLEEIVTGEDAQRSYRASFDQNYFLQNDEAACHLREHINDHSRITDEAHTLFWIGILQELKLTMDYYLHRHPRLEREFQQIAVRENNTNLRIANATEYFFTDIEYTEPNTPFRFDMLAVRWLASQRNTSDRCKPVIMEMKYGDAALNGNAGLTGHLDQVDQYLAKDENQNNLCETILSQFNQLDELSLISFKKTKNWKGLSFNEEKPEVIIVLANHNPRSKDLKNILYSKEVHKYDNSDHFDLRFFSSTFCGYCMHQSNMLTLEEIKSRL